MTTSTLAVSQPALQRIPFPIKLLFMSTILLSALTPNPAYTVFAILFLAVIYKMFWEKDVPAVIFWGLLIQWLSITLKVFYADLLGLSFSDSTLSLFPSYIGQAYLLSLYGLSFYIFGLYISYGSVRKVRINLRSMLVYDIKKLFVFYIVFQLAINGLIGIFGNFTGISQLLFAVDSLKWGFLFLIFYNVYKKKAYRVTFVLLLTLEIILSFATYWSSFKNYLIYLVIFLPMLNLRSKSKKYALLLVLMIVGMSLVLVWEGIKEEYRSYLSKGLREQVVLVSPTQAISTFFKMATTADLDIQNVTRSLVDRVSYIDFFSGCISYIPRTLPYQGGRILLRAFTYDLTPRILFPDKHALDDSKELNRLTGLSVGTAAQGTAMSLGYMGESYADFGPFLMIVPIFIMGLLTGFAYKYVMSRAKSDPWKLILMAHFFFLTSVNGMDEVKILGNLGWYVILCFLLTTFGMTKLDAHLK